MMPWRKDQRMFDVACTIEIEHTRESLHAHVTLDSQVVIQPGDQVIVHGESIYAAFGEKLVVQRRATIVRAGVLERLRTRLSAYLELTELYEVGFSAGRHA